MNRNAGNAKNIIARMQRASRAVVWIWFGLLFATAASAQGVSLISKLSPDLLALLEGNPAVVSSATNWHASVSGQSLVKVLIVSNSSDPSLSNLRTAVVNAGGSVFYNFISIRGVMAILPTSQVQSIANRSDVVSITPNRTTHETASVLQTLSGVTGSLTSITNSGNTVDGTGIGIAFLDSGIMSAHPSLLNSAGLPRTVRAVNLLNFGDSVISSTSTGGYGQLGAKNWALGIDVSAQFALGSTLEQTIESALSYFPTAFKDDPYGHGTHVASVAAGNGSYQKPNVAGVAPNASIIDVRVLDDTGYGEVSDVLAGLDWVIFHRKDFGINVLNLSLAADSTESYLDDPLCQAVRNVEATGITVVVAAGNFGGSVASGVTYGTVSSPGDEPSVITVGSANMHASTSATAATVNYFSSRGPTRGSSLAADGTRVYDNLLKPDLVAPGNAILGAESINNLGTQQNALATEYPQLQKSSTSNNLLGVTGRLMYLSGTSIAAPAVSGTVALMLQVNPGLTPPLIKAILQYTAQPIAGAGLADQGTGLLNTAAAVSVAAALRTDISSAIAQGSLSPGMSLLRAGPIPTPACAPGTSQWSGLVFAGGDYLLGGIGLLDTYQPIYDPRTLWVDRSVTRLTINYSTSGTVTSFVSAPAGNQLLVSGNVVNVTSLAGETRSEAESKSVRAWR
ncbi:MAG: S8 family serine peptidase [Burkholderiaceae bacterium]